MGDLFFIYNLLKEISNKENLSPHGKDTLSNYISDNEHDKYIIDI